MKSARLLSVFIGGVATAIALTVWAQAGYPTRPRFLSVGVGCATPNTNGDACVGDDLTVTDQITATGTYSAAGSQPLRIVSNTPAFSFLDSNAAADGQRWIDYVQGAAREFTVANDAESSVASWMTVTRSGATVTNLDMDATAITLNNVATSDFARLSQANVFTVPNQVLSAAGSPAWVVTDTTTPTTSVMQTTDTTAFVGTTTAHALELISGNATRIAITGNGSNTTISTTAITGPSSVDMTPSSGTFTASYTNACTTTPTQSIRWYKIGNVVTMTAAAALSCTADTTLFDTDASDLPAAIRPTTSNVYSAKFGANNNSTSVSAMIELNGGEIIVNRCDTVTGTCDGGAWTNSGTRGLDAWTLTYVL